jgi:hypothetical protein
VKKRFRNVPFKFNLYRYNQGRAASDDVWRLGLPEHHTGAFHLDDPVVGLYKLNPVDPYLESTRFQPLHPSRDFLVSKVCFQLQLVPLHRGGRVHERHESRHRVRHQGAAVHVRMQLTHSLKAPGLVSTLEPEMCSPGFKAFAFKLNLHRYTEVIAVSPGYAWWEFTN